jgi:tetratricopeptide (TPR) repeat protein
MTMGYALTHRYLAWGITTLILFVLMARKLKYGNLMFLLLAAYWLMVTYSIIRAVNPGEAVGQSSEVILMIAYLAVAVKQLKNNESFPKVLILLTIFIAIYSYIRPVGILAYKNQTSYVLFMLMVLCAYYYKYWPIPSVIAIATSLIAIALLGARSVYLAIFVSGVVLVITNKKYLIITACVFMAVGAIAYKNSNVFNTESLNHRKEIWTQTLKMIKHNPSGVGAGNWKMIYPAYSAEAPLSRANNYVNRFVIRVHNDFLEKCAEIGALGMLIYISIFVLAIYYSNGWIRAGIIGYICVAFLSFPASRPFPSMLLMIYFAHAIKDHIRSVKFKPFCTVVITTLLVIGVINFTIRHLGARQVVRIYSAQIENDWDAILSETEKISPLFNIDPVSATPLSHYRGIAYHSKGDNVNAMKSFEDAARIAPYHLYNLMNLAMMYQVDCQYDMAKHVYFGVVQMYPDFEDAKNGIKNIETANQMIRKAVEEIRRFGRGV